MSKKKFSVTKHKLAMILSIVIVLFIMSVTASAEITDQSKNRIIYDFDFEQTMPDNKWGFDVLGTGFDMLQIDDPTKSGNKVVQFKGGNNTGNQGVAQLDISVSDETTFVTVDFDMYHPLTTSGDTFIRFTDSQNKDIFSLYARESGSAENIEGKMMRYGFNTILGNNSLSEESKKSAKYTNVEQTGNVGSNGIWYHISSTMDFTTKKQSLIITNSATGEKVVELKEQSIETNEIVSKMQIGYGWVTADYPGVYIDNLKIADNATYYPVETVDFYNIGSSVTAVLKNVSDQELLSCNVIVTGYNSDDKLVCVSQKNIELDYMSEQEVKLDIDNKEDIESLKLLVWNGFDLMTPMARKNELVTGISKYNQIWTTQSKNSSESMPVGGHDVGLNVWVENNNVYFYMDKSGSFDENNQMLKLGRVKVELLPNPFAEPDCKFSQELILKDGYIQISADTEKYGNTKINIWTESFESVAHVDIISDTEIDSQISYEGWRNDKRTMTGMNTVERRACISTLWYPGEVFTNPDTVTVENEGILFFHRNNNDELIFDKVVKQQGLEDYKDSMVNTQKNRTFGGFMTGENMSYLTSGSGTYASVPYKSWTLKSNEPSNIHKVKIYMHTNQSETLDDWKEELYTLVNRTEDDNEAWEQTKKWWNDYWSNSVIDIKSATNKKAEEISKNYNLFRYMLGCNAYGEYPTKFNGGLFITDPVYSVGSQYSGKTPDQRDWGGGSFTAQNQRLVYWPMLKTGDFELMLPQFEYYLRALSNAELRTRVYWDHEGASFCEQLENFGLPIGGWHYGPEDDTDKQWEPGFDKNDNELLSPWIKYEYVNQLEFSYMILQYKRYSGSDITRYMPFIESSVKFFDEHYQKRNFLETGSNLDENGKLVISPSTAGETYKDAVNPTDVIAGLSAVTDELIELCSEELGEEKVKYYSELQNRIPEIPLRERSNKTTISPAESFTSIMNVEIPQLYPVFPYGQYGLGKENLQIAIDTWKYGVENSNQKNYISWHQDNIFCARMGLVDEAASITTKKLQDSGRRFPAFWGPGHDWVPDHNWGGSGMIGLQDMIMQTNGDEIILFGAWPKDWDVEFKLHAPRNTVVEGVYRNGEVTELKVTPKEREDDIRIMN